MLATTSGVSVQLPQFEGPLALLLYLIRKEEMDIFDIPIHKITRQYLDYIKLMKELDLEVAGEFIAMAATLIQLKSRMLLPRYNDEGEIIEEEDPRKELVQRLLEYQKFQEVAKNLNERPLLGRDVWTRGVREKFEAPEEEIILEENALFSLISAYKKSVALFKRKVHKVTKKAQSIASRILEIRDRLFVGKQVPMSELLTAVENKRIELLITFLSTLELAKMNFVRLFQADAYQEIYIEAVRPIAGDEISKVEEYDRQAPSPSASALAIAAGLDDDEILEPIEVDLAEDSTSAPIQYELAGLDFVETDAEAEVEAEIANDEDILAAEAELGLDPEIITQEDSKDA